MSSSTYGPSAIATPANLVTFVRILASPVAVMMVINRSNPWATLGLWVFLGVADRFDGEIARRQGTTRSGAFLDPLADKIMVFGMFGALVYQSRIALLPVVIMAIRELIISGYRTVVAKKGISVPARKLGKWKMTAQVLSICLALIPVGGLFTTFTRTVLVSVIIWIATALALGSAYQYLSDASRNNKVTS